MDTDSGENIRDKTGDGPLLSDGEDELKEYCSLVRVDASRDFMIALMCQKNVQCYGPEGGLIVLNFILTTIFATMKMNI